MLTPERLEQLIITEKNNCESWIIDQLSSGADLSEPLGGLCKNLLTTRGCSWPIKIMLLVAKSLTPQVPVSLFHFSSLCELLLISRLLKEHALWKSSESDAITKPFAENTVVQKLLKDHDPDQIHLMSDLLASYALEQLSGFHIPRMNEQFAQAQKIYFESKIQDVHHIVNNMDSNRYLEAYKNRILKKQPLLIKCIVEGGARLCGTHVSQIKELGTYAEQLCAGITVINELSVIIHVPDPLIGFCREIGDIPQLSENERGTSPYYLFAKALNTSAGHTSTNLSESAPDSRQTSIVQKTQSTGDYDKEVIQSLIRDAQLHFDNAFSSLVSLNSFQQQTPLLALVELSISICQKLDDQLKGERANLEEIKNQKLSEESSTKPAEDIA